MSFSINQALLVGNVSQEPELRYTPSGRPVCSFSMATNRSVKNSNGSYDNLATFHKVIVWSKLGEWVSKNMSKGDRVVVKGRIDTRSYEKDGQTRYVTEIVADDVIPSTGRANNPNKETPIQGNREEAWLPSEDNGEDISSSDLADQIPL